MPSSFGSIHRRTPRKGTAKHCSPVRPATPLVHARRSGGPVPASALHHRQHVLSGNGEQRETSHFKNLSHLPERKEWKIAKPRFKRSCGKSQGPRPLCANCSSALSTKNASMVKPTSGKWNNATNSTSHENQDRRNQGCPRTSGVKTATREASADRLPSSFMRIWSFFRSRESLPVVELTFMRRSRIVSL